MEKCITMCFHFGKYGNLQMTFLTSFCVFEGFLPGEKSSQLSMNRQYIFNKTEKRKFAVIVASKNIY
jgi:hypothetical protein